MFRLSARFSEGAEKVTDLFWDEVHNHHRRKYAEHLEDPLHDLTQAFVSELNKHAGLWVRGFSAASKFGD
jgi:hypothetical protein